MAGPDDFDSYGDTGMPGMGGGYGDGAAYQTDLRAGYGNSPLFAMGGGLQTVSGQSYNGQQNMFSAIGGHIRPLAYTPPAFVVTGYSGRHIQQQGVWNSLRNMVGIGPMIRGARDYDISQNAASDLGERGGLMATGVGMSAFESGVGAIGAMGGMMAGFGAYALAGKATGMVREAVQQRREIEQYLDMSSDRYVSAGSAPGMVDQRRGQGFSTSARREVAEFIRGMDIKDPLLNTQELTGILKGATEAGMFTGTRDMDDFKKKFKDIVENVKAVTTTLHQTLDEGLKTMKDLRGIGVDPSQVRDVALRAEAFGRASGRTAGEMMNLGMQGAELYRGTGVDMKIGFEANLMNAAAIRSSRDAGLLSQEAIAQAGGEEALAQRMTAGSLGYAQSSMGRGMAGAVFSPGAGGGTGFDMAAYLKFVSGNQTMGQVGQTAAHNLGSPAAMIAFQAHQAEMFSAMGKVGGGAGIGLFQDASAMLMAQQIAKATGGSTEDSLKAVFIQQMGKSESEADAEIARIKNADKGFRAAQRGTEQTRSEQMIQEASQNFFLSRLGSEIGDKVKTVVDLAASPLNRFVDTSSDAMKNFTDRSLYGIERVTINESGRDDFVGSGVASDILDRGADLDEGGLFAATPGNDLRDMIRRNGDRRGAFSMRHKRVKPYRVDGEAPDDPGMNVHVSDNFYTSASEIRRVAAAGRAMSRTVMEAQAAEAADKTGAFKDARAKVAANLMKINRSNRPVADGDIDDLVFRATGETAGDLKPGSLMYDALLLETQNMGEYTSTLDSTRRDAAVALGAEGRLLSNSTKRAVEAGEAAGERLNSSLVRGTAFGAGPTLSGAMLNRLAKVNELSGGRGGDASAGMAEAKDAVRKMAQGLAGDDGVAVRRQIESIITNAEMAPAGDFKAWSAVNRELSARQQARGFQVLSSALDKDLAVTADVSAENRQRIYGVMDRIVATGAQAVLELKTPAFKKDFDALASVPTGVAIQHEAELLQKVSSMGEGRSRDSVVSEMRSVPGVGAAMALTIGDAYEAHGTAGAVQAVHGATQENLASATITSAAGASAGVGTAAGTAADQYSLQTSQNLAVLAILQGLAAKLGVY